MENKRQLVVNSLSLLFNRLGQSIAAFVLVTAIARILGAYALGQYLLAFSYYFVFMTIVSSGFKSLFTRELSRNPLEIPVCLVSGSLLQLFFSFFGYGVLVIVVFALPYSPDTSTICYIMGLTLIPFSLSNVTEAIFQAQERMHLITISTMPIYILRVLIMILAMNLGYGVNFLSALLVISETLILLVEWLLIVRSVRPQWQVDWNFMERNIKSVFIFLTIDGTATVKERMQILTLSLLGGGELGVGFYGAIAQLIQPFHLIASSLVIAVFPRMTKAVNVGREQQKELAERLVEILLLAALPLIIWLLFMGRDLLVFIYRDPSFAQAAVALSIVSLGLITTSFTRPLSYNLVASGFERVNLFEVTISAILGGFLSVVLVSQYQLNGAAIAALLMEIFSCSMYVYFVYTRLFSLQLRHVLRRPLVVSILMLAVFVILQKINTDILITLVISTFAYILLVSITGIYVLGMPEAVWEKLLRKK